MNLGKIIRLDTDFEVTSQFFRSVPCGNISMISRQRISLFVLSAFKTVSRLPLRVKTTDDLQCDKCDEFWWNVKSRKSVGRSREERVGINDARDFERPGDVHRLRRSTTYETDLSPLQIPIRASASRMRLLQLLLLLLTR